MTATTKLSQECIYEKKVAEIKARQDIAQTNAKYKVEKLEKAERQAAELAAQRAERRAAQQAAPAKYATRR